MKLINYRELISEHEKCTEHIFPRLIKQHLSPRLDNIAFPFKDANEGFRYRVHVENISYPLTLQIYQYRDEFKNEHNSNGVVHYIRL